jgi:hypothetical protein
MPVRIRENGPDISGSDHGAEQPSDEEEELVDNASECCVCMAEFYSESTVR